MLFNSFYANANNQAFNIIMSISVLIYKMKCKQYSNKMAVRKYIKIKTTVAQGRQKICKLLEHPRE